MSQCRDLPLTVTVTGDGEQFTITSDGCANCICTQAQYTVPWACVSTESPVTVITLSFCTIPCLEAFLDLGTLSVTDDARTLYPPQDVYAATVTVRGTEEPDF